MAFSLFPKSIKQWKVVLIAFLAATTFWFFNSLNKEYTTTLSHPVDFHFNQDSLIAVKPLPSEVELDVTGGGWSLIRKTSLFNPGPIKIELQNPGGMKFLSWLEVLPIIREQMGEINVNQVLQDTFSVQIEPILQKEVVLRVDSTKIKLEPDYQLTSSIEIPENRVLLTGPKSFIDSIGSTYKLLLLEDEIEDDFDEEVSVSVPRPNLIQANPSEVRVMFKVDRFDELQLDVPVQGLNFPADSSALLSPRVVTLKFRVRRDLLQDYRPEDFSVIADYELAAGDSLIVPIINQYPEEITELSIEPPILNIVPNE